MLRRSFLRGDNRSIPRFSSPPPGTVEDQSLKTSANIPVVATPSGTKRPVPTLTRTRYQKPATIGVLRIAVDSHHGRVNVTGQFPNHPSGTPDSRSSVTNGEAGP